MAKQAGIRVTYDPEADVFAIHLAPLRTALGASELTRDHYAHLDPRGRLVALEILRASQHYDRDLLGQTPSPATWLTLPEAAEAVGLAETTLRGQIRAGRLQALKRGRDWLVAEHDLWNYLDSRSRRGRRSEREAPRSKRRVGAAR